jgi:hypothetical protein
MDVRMPDGVVVKNVPEGVTQDELLERYSLSKQPQRTKGTNISSDVPQVITAQNRGSVTPVEQPTSMMDKIKALGEVPLTMASGAIAQPVGAAYGVAKGILGPKTPQGMQEAQQAGGQLAQKLQYQPTSPASVNALESIGGALEAAKIPPYLGAIGAIPSAIQAGNVARPAAQQAVQAAKPVMQEIKPTLANALRGKVTVEGAPTMAGVGAAEVPEAAIRMQMAQQLRVPVELSKGQALRDLGQQKFEIETPKNFPELGKPLIEAQAKRNDAILQNFDAFVDATGKETYGLRETGRIVDKALVNEANKRKSEINAAYTAAREAGETQQPVDYAPLKAYIDEQTPTVKRKLAPIISAVDEEIARNDPSFKTGQISINNLEDIYQFINKNYELGTVGEGHAKAMKNIINQMTEGQGGELYQQARNLRTKYGREFENVGYVDKLLRTKPGTTDRAVAFEDVFDHAILNGSLDDVSAIGRTLKKAGPEGQQAWKELQGQTIEYIKRKATNTTDKDIYGNPVVMPKQLKIVVDTLDQDGKLDYVFGKKGAQELRDLTAVTETVNAPLKGAANYSNTSSAIITALDKINATPLGKIPVLGTASKFIAEKGKESALKKQIEESINYKPEDMARALKGK